MTEKSFCKKQIMRLSALDRFPSEPEAVNEVILALQCAAHEGHAKEFVTGIVETGSVCPKPAEIRRALFARMEKVSSIGCSQCSGLGFIHTARIINGERYDYSAPCRCHPGREEVA